MENSKMESLAPEPSQEDNTYLNQLIAERDGLDPSYVNALKLLSDEITAVQAGKKRDQKEVYLDVVNPRKTKIEARITIPVNDFPKYNFVGKLLGPKGSSLQQLQEETRTKMSILGRGSMKDKNKEEELRKEGNPKYAHLNKDLHLLIEAYCPALEAYNRVTHAIGEVQKFLIPDPNDEIRQGQLMELGFNSGPPLRGRGGPARGAGRGLSRPGAPPLVRAPPRGSPRGRPAPGGRGGGYRPSGLGRGGAPRPLAYQATEEEYYEESYDQGYDDSYDGYGAQSRALAADDGGYGYDRSAGDGYQSYDYGGYGSSSAGNSGAGGVGASSYGGGASNPRLKAPGGYSQKPAARQHPYAHPRYQYQS